MKNDPRNQMDGQTRIKDAHTKQEKIFNMCHSLKEEFDILAREQNGRKQIQSGYEDEKHATNEISRCCDTGKSSLQTTIVLTYTDYCNDKFGAEKRTVSISKMNHIERNDNFGHG